MLEFVLFVFKLGTTIVVPGIDKSSLGTSNLGILELMNIMGGGALEQFSIFALGVTPYITASIIIQLLEMDIIPYFSELSKEGPVGRRKLNQITRYVGIVFAFIEGYAFSFAFLGASSAFEYLYVATILTAGTAFCLWLGDQIIQKGIGDTLGRKLPARNARYRKAVPGRQGAGPCQTPAAPRLHPRPDGRERRRQIGAHEVPVRYL